mmetsp:Transcript_20805/g.31828  ORF Transcript_20805/g.31828 Transcript_20805/m.31828 type:complete len:629 (+) Transcript_20805:105-1991(+)|eukprot:CAMPEP_0197315334 /NCGR_PEP_ID=MMETSP0891-20130614/37784_1 /TAXON_ID=44058 ORGANISM="Aureoumbra lagunensis, Strain CCMP1510" /NCGR_SAMPLE_ID=MMETSP0891 /ASSEMBLY_ACC=CAM_ASM_000534 /LENGTH=628 /DNA_ID=CAMNT_0042804225 /DNA_START=84 /DNA_END=1970 /DNA_ORIENTATION=+
MAPPRPPRGHHRARPHTFRGAKTWTKAGANNSKNTKRASTGDTTGNNKTSAAPPIVDKATQKTIAIVTNPARSLAMQESLLQRGIAQMESGAIASACDLLGAALRLEFRADIAAKQAKCELELEKYEAAIALCDQALKVEPKLSLALEIKEKALKQIIKQREGWKNRKSHGNELFAAGDYAKALEAYDAALEVCDEIKNRPVLFTNRASCFLRLGNAQACIDACDQALALNSKWARAYERKAQALDQIRGKRDQARQVIDQGLAELPGNSDLLALERSFNPSLPENTNNKRDKEDIITTNAANHFHDDKKQKLIIDKAPSLPTSTQASAQQHFQQHLVPPNQQQHLQYSSVNANPPVQVLQQPQQLIPRPMLQQPRAINHQIQPMYPHSQQQHHLQQMTQQLGPPITLQPIPSIRAPTQPLTLLPMPTMMPYMQSMQYPPANYARSYHPPIQQQNQYSHVRRRQPQMNDNRFQDRYDDRHRQRDSDYQQRRPSQRPIHRSSPSPDDKRRRRSSSSSHSDHRRSRRRSRSRSPSAHRAVHSSFDDKNDDDDEFLSRRERRYEDYHHKDDSYQQQDENNIEQQFEEVEDHDVFQSAVVVKSNKFDEDDASDDQDDSEDEDRHNPRRRYGD